MTETPEAKPTYRHPMLGVILIIGGLAGLLASFQLTLDKFAVLTNPSADLSCNVSILVQCSKNLGAAQGAIFGFPNPLLGLMMFPAAIIMGVAVLGLVRFPRWFWAVFNLGMLFAIGLAAYLITQSIFVLGTLCLWCLLVWVVVIPMSLATTLSNMAHGVFGRWLVRPGEALVGWVPLMTLIIYIIIGTTYQVELNALNRLGF